jgi:ribonuclease Z
LDDKLIDKAIESSHSTPSEAAEIAKQANVGQLVLLHISPRYKSDEVLLEQARKIFPNTIVANDLVELEVRPKE